MRRSSCQVVVTAAALWMCAPVQAAKAFGGLWSTGSAPVRQTATQVIFVDNPDSTMTALVRIHYAGAADAFAWLIPIPGTPTVAVSSSTVFERLDVATAPEYWLEYSLAGSCTRAATDAAVPMLPDASDTPSHPVAVLEQGSVGPYDYVTIAVEPNAADPTRAATDWLTSNGFALTGLDTDALAPYLRAGLNLLAFKLAKASDTGAIKPVVLTYQSQRPIIPLRPAALATAGELGIQVWVLGASQAVPTNYRSLVLNDARIDWLSAERFRAGTLPSGGAGPFGAAIDVPANYDAVVSEATREAGGRGFVTELAAPASQFRNKVWSEVDEQLFMVLSTQSYEDGVDAVSLAVSSYPGWDGLKEAIEGATTLPAGVTLEAFSADPTAHRGTARVDIAKFLELLRERAIQPVIDAAALLHGAPYLTRLYSVMHPDAMTEDPAFDYNFDLAPVSSVHIGREFLECGEMPDPANASWRIDLPQGGTVAGAAGSSWPDLATLPANLKVVDLSTQGSGTVVRDNSREIGRGLLASFGASNRTTLPPPSIGLTIGGTQHVATRTDEHPGAPSESSSDGCSVSRASTGSASWLLPLALWLIARCRRASCKHARGRASVARGALE